MRINQLFTYCGMSVIILLLFISCSKDNDIRNPVDEGHKSEGAGDKVFAGDNSHHDFAAGKYLNMINGYMSHYNFESSPGFNNFTGSATGDEGGGSPGTGNGSVTINGETHPLFFGAFEGYNDGWFDLYLLDIVPTSLDDEIENFTGLIFELISNSVYEIAAGTYNYSLSEEPFTFDYAEIGFNINTDFEEYFEITDGTIHVSKSGNNYSVNFEGMIEDGRSIGLNFSGQLLNLNDEPDPQPTGLMTAVINGNNWSAEDVYASIDGDYLYLSGMSGNEYIYISLNSYDLSSGSVLTMENLGVNNAYYSNNNDFYSAYSVYMYISGFNSSSISGTFEFEAYNSMSGNTISITNGTFANVPIY